jgi:hypothetical protein
VSSPLDGTWFEEATYLVLNYDNSACRLGDLSACDIDPDYTPTRTHYRSSPDSNEVVYAQNLGDLLAIVDTDALLGGFESDDEFLKGILASIGVDLLDIGLERTIGTGAPPLVYPYDDNIVIVREFEAVPEPATFLLMSLGLAGLGFARRRRLDS